MSMTDAIIGRHEEQDFLKRPLSSQAAEFVAVYGRRRVGKTYLIRNFFKGQPCLYFEATGLKDGNHHQQLKLLTAKIAETFYGGLPLETPKTWLDAFKLLTIVMPKPENPFM